MTKMDFSAVKDARVGSTEVQRIYRGENKVWNRYCWEKWSCSASINNYATASSTGNTKDYVGSHMAKNLYKTRTRDGLTYVFSNKADPNTYNYESAYKSGYKYMSTKTTLEIGDTYWLAKSVVENMGERNVRFEEYKVKIATSIGDYKQGTTSYGIVEGSAGDYPDNGRHSDGYWYVRVAPQGVKEE